jgi:hypothetical protein
MNNSRIEENPDYIKLDEGHTIEQIMGNLKSINIENEYDVLVVSKIEIE